MIMIETAVKEIETGTAVTETAIGDTITHIVCGMITMKELRDVILMMIAVTLRTSVGLIDQLMSCRMGMNAPRHQHEGGVQTMMTGSLENQR